MSSQKSLLRKYADKGIMIPVSGIIDFFKKRKERKTKDRVRKLKKILSK